MGKGKSKGKDKGKDKVAGTATELHTAARSGDMQRLQAMLADTEQSKAVNGMDQHRRTPLHLAAFFGNASAVKALLDHGADIQSEAMDGFLALHFAAQAGRLEVVRALIRHLGSGGDHGAVKRHVNRVVQKGKKSALHLAVQKGHVEVARFLVMKGASADLKTAQGQTAIDLCGCETLRAELRGAAATVANEEAEKDKTTASDEPPTKRRAMTEPGSEAEQVKICFARQSSASEAPKGATDCSPLACGPVPLDRVKVGVAEGERSYPAGTAAMADVHWSFATKEEPHLSDGPVWSLVSQEVQSIAGESAMHLSLQRSTYKLLLYTHFSDEGSLMPKETRCNACGLTPLLLTSDGFILLCRNSNSGSPWLTLPASCIMTAPSVAGVVAATLREVGPSLGDATVALASAHLLAVAEADDDAFDGLRHHLIVSVRLSVSAAEIQAGINEAVPESKAPRELQFVRHGQCDAAIAGEGLPRSVTLESAL
eukprot:CAMPEP_0115600958 /NCGR_PEP_ID=MMETSP0272-20121206/15154_1 /TAXON_ID=71861 /ORGANISM="Scrippsiella trochoidea, Strain CCMP3099" /LENGTH=483 /DNA_ID=CAMNT_0003036413 /DNA_START=48 /DNA_END=1496 /DNA_ORIENTATION=-